MWIVIIVVVANVSTKLSGQLLCRLLKFTETLGRTSAQFRKPKTVRYFHLARSRSTDAQNSSELIGLTAPESSSLRRRTASLREAASASAAVQGQNGKHGMVPETGY